MQKQSTQVSLPCLLDEEGFSAFPVWVAERYAAALANVDWTDSEPVAIELEEWLPRLEDDGIRIVVFMTPDDMGIVIEAEQLAADLDGEISE